MQSSYYIWCKSISIRKVKFFIVIHLLTDSSKRSIADVKTGFGTMMEGVATAMQT